MARRVAFLGTGGIARHHLRSMCQLGDRCEAVALIEPAEPAREATRTFFKEKIGAECPPFYDDYASAMASPRCARSPRRGADDYL